MDTTQIQKRIELSVTGGLGYDSRTDFSESSSIYLKYLDQEDVKNTDEGIRAHLREIDRPEIRKYGKVSGHLFSSTGRKMPIYSLSIWRFIQMKIKNKRLIDKAYNSEAKRRGRFNVVLDGLLKRWTFKRVN